MIYTDKDIERMKKAIAKERFRRGDLNWNDDTENEKKARERLTQMDILARGTAMEGEK